MLAFLKANVYNIIVIAIVLLVVFLIIRKIVKDKRQAKVLYVVEIALSAIQIAVTKLTFK